MSTLVYATDIHLTDKQPVNRLTAVYPRCLDKFSAVLDFAAHNGGVLILGGDLFDVPCPSYHLLEATINLLGCYKNLVKVFLVKGNHDLKYLNDFQETGVSTLHAAQLIECLEDARVINGFLVAPLPYSRELAISKVESMSDPATNGKYSLYTDDFAILEEPHPIYENIDLTAFPTVLVAHLPIVSEPVPYSAILCNEIATNFDFILCGHIHSPFDVHIPSSARYGFTKLLNPGCLTRLKSNEATQKPQLIVMTNVDNKVAYKFVPLLGCEDVKFREKKEETVVFSKVVKEEKKIDIDDVTTYIQNSKYRDAVKKEALRLINDKQGVIDD